MLVQFGNVGKNPNSTKRPPTSTSVEVWLKEGTSREAPTFIVQRYDETSWSWVYAYCPTFKRYYYVTDVEYSESCMYVRCTADALATCSEDLKSLFCQVDYSSVKYNGYMPDPRYPTPRKETTYIKKVEGSDIVGRGEYYSVSVWGQGNSTESYALRPSEYQQLVSYLNSGTVYNDWSASLSQIAEALKTSFFNPSQYLVRVLKMPFAPYVQGRETIGLGFSKSPVSGIPLGNTWYKDIITLNPQDAYPLINKTNYFLRWSPYTTYVLHIPYIGEVPYTPVQDPSTTAIRIVYTVYIDGKITAEVLEDWRPVARYYGCCSVAAGVNGIDQNTAGNMISKGVTAASSIGGALLTGNPAMMVGALESATSAFKHDAELIGQVGGSICEDAFPFSVTATCTAPIVSEPKFGYAYGRCDRLSNHWGGYVQCSKLYTEGDFPPALLSECRSMLAQGVFLED